MGYYDSDKLQASGNALDTETYYGFVFTLSGVHCPIGFRYKFVPYDVLESDYVSNRVIFPTGFNRFITDYKARHALSEVFRLEMYDHTSGEPYIISSPMIVHHWNKLKAEYTRVKTDIVKSIKYTEGQWQAGNLTATKFKQVMTRLYAKLDNIGSIPLLTDYIYNHDFGEGHELILAHIPSDMTTEFKYSILRADRRGKKRGSRGRKK